jgi:hypothetical protein
VSQPATECLDRVCDFDVSDAFSRLANALCNRDPQRRQKELLSKPNSAKTWNSQIVKRSNTGSEIQSTSSPFDRDVFWAK